MKMLARFMLAALFALALSVDVPVNAQSQTDALSGPGGWKGIKEAVDVATTANITLSGTQTIDGVAVTAGDRVLVKNQTDGSENGIYTVSASAWARAVDWNDARDISSGTMVFTTQGSANAYTIFYVSTTGTITIGTTSISFGSLGGSLSTSAFVDTLLDDTTAGAFMTTLGISSFAQTILDDANAAAVRTTIGVGTAGASATGTSGATVPLLDGDNTHSGDNTFSGTNTFTTNTTTFHSIEAGTPTGSPSEGQINATAFLVNGTNLIQTGTPADQDFNDDATLTFAHGLGAFPSIVKVYLVATAADNGYSIGDIVEIGNVDNDSERGCTRQYDTTNVYVICGTTFQLVNKSTFNVEDIDELDWDVRVRAFKFNP